MTPQTLQLLNENPHDRSTDQKLEMLFKKPENDDGNTQDFPTASPRDAGTARKGDSTKTMKLVVQRVTKFESILIDKVFFSNKNVYGNLMITTCKQVQKKDDEADETSRDETDILMLHRIKDLFQ